MFPSRYMPCPDCGASLERDERRRHSCERERSLDYQMFQLRGQVEGLELAIDAYLNSPAGRFEGWYAQRERKRRRSES